MVLRYVHVVWPGLVLLLAGNRAMPAVSSASHGCRVVNGTGFDYCQRDRRRGNVHQLRDTGATASVGCQNEGEPSGT